MMFGHLTEQILSCAIEVHRGLGPGLLESTYEHCLTYELSQASLAVCRQVPLPVRYKGVTLDCGYRLDLIVEEKVLLELKSVDALVPLHSAQILTYLKLSGLRCGLLINFNVELLKDGIKRFVR